MRSLSISLLMLTVLSAASAVFAEPLSREERAAVERAVLDRMPGVKRGSFRHKELRTVRGESSPYCASVNGVHSERGELGWVPFLALLYFDQGRLQNVTVVAVGNPSDQTTSAAILLECREHGY